MGDRLFVGFIFIFLIAWVLMCISILIKPTWVVNQTIFWNKWFLNHMGYEVEIKPKKNAEQVIRVWTGLCLFIIFIVISMGFDIFMMLFRQ